MGKRKITCNNSSCKHHTNGGCDTYITLDGSGKCKSFEKGFAYYFHIVWDALDNKNFIDMVEIRMNPDLKTGLMGYTDEDFDRAKAVQERNGKYYKALYDQAGNSIAVPIFESIFRKIILQEVA